MSIWARFGPMVLGSPGRKLSLVDPAWQRDTSETHEINQTVFEIVSVSSKESNFNQENNSLVLCQSNTVCPKVRVKFEVPGSSLISRLIPKPFGTVNTSVGMSGAEFLALKLIYWFCALTKPAFAFSAPRQLWDRSWVKRWGTLKHCIL